MKRGILLIIVLSLIVSVLAVPMVYAESVDTEASISINAVKIPTREVDLRDEIGTKSIDVFVGEEINVKTDIIVDATIVIEDADTIIADYHYDKDMLDATIKRGNEVVRGGNYDTSTHYVRRENCLITPKKVGKSQLIVSYKLGKNTYFDSLDINAVENTITSMELKPNVTTVRTNSKVDFDLVINKSNTLTLSKSVDYYINDVKLDSLKDYSIDGNTNALNVKIVYDGKEYTETIPVVSAMPLDKVETPSTNYGYLLKRETGKIELYTTANAYPNISIISDNGAVNLEKVDKVESDREGMDKYELTIRFKKAVTNDKLLINADNKSIVCNLNIIDNILTFGIVPENTKAESGKTNRFHIVINGVKDVDTPVKWTVNGTEQSNQSNVLEYKSISNNVVKITANVEDSMAEYSYTIDTSTSSIILTVVVSIIVIILCIPILIGLKKSPKPNLKAMIIKDSKANIDTLNKIKSELDSEEQKHLLKHILKVAASITRSEKRAQQESFDCENKAFGGALNALTEAKALIDDLVVTYKTNKDVTKQKIDTIVSLLDTAIATVNKVEENMK